MLILASRAFFFVVDHVVHPLRDTRVLQNTLAIYKQIQPSDHGILDGESQNGSLLELDTDSAEDAPVAVARKPTRKISTVALKSTPRPSNILARSKGKGKDRQVTVDEDGDEEMVSKHHHLVPAPAKASYPVWPR